MSLWTDITRTFSAGERSAKGASGRQTIDRNSPFQFDVNALVYSGGIMTRELAATVSAVNRAVTLISGSGADAIIDTLRVVDAETNKSASTNVTRYVIAKLKDTPDGICPAHTFFEDALVDLVASGNAVFKTTRNSVNSWKTKLELCHPLSATGYIDSNGRTTFRVTPDNDAYANVEVLPSTRVIIARWPRVGQRVIAAGSGRSRWFAQPPIQSIGAAIMLAKDAETWASKVFDRSSGAIGSDYVISVAHELIGADAEERLLKAIEAMAHGRAPLVLGGGAKVDRMSPTPQDADLLALREFQVEEISRLFGVPSILLNKSSDGNTWGSSIAALEKAFQRYGLRLHINRLLEPLSYRLLPPGFRFAVDESRAYRGDAVALSQLINATVPNTGRDAILSKAEIRALIGVDGDYKDDWGEGTGGVQNAPRGGMQND